MSSFALRTLVFAVIVVITCVCFAIRYFRIGKKDDSNKKWMPFAASALFSLSALFLTGFGLVAYEII